MWSRVAAELISWHACLSIGLGTCLSTCLSSWCASGRLPATPPLLLPLLPPHSTRPTAALLPPAPCSARANNNAAEVLAAHYYSHMPSDDECVEGKGASSKDADLKPLLREGPVKGAIAAVHDGQL